MMATPRIPEPPHLMTDLKTLCLATIAAHWERFAQEARRKRQPHADYLADLVVMVPHVLPPNSARVGRGAGVVFPLLGEG